MLADAKCVEHTDAENGSWYLGLATLIAVVAICRVAERDDHVTANGNSSMSTIASQTIK